MKRPLGPTSSCTWCGARASPVKGVILERLYPGRTACSGCGLLQVHCSCQPAIEVRKAA